MLIYEHNLCDVDEAFVLVFVFSVKKFSFLLPCFTDISCAKQTVIYYVALLDLWFEIKCICMLIVCWTSQLGKY